MKTAIIGNGHWSKILQKYIRDIRYIADSKFDKSKIWNDSDIRCVFVVTPIHTHYEIAKEALCSGKHVFVEKPITMDIKEANELAELAHVNNLVLFTDYTYTFSEKLKSFTDVRYIFIKLFRDNSEKYKNVNVHWVLTPHILSIVNRFFGLKNIKLVNQSLHSGYIHNNHFKAYVSLEKPNKTDISILSNERAFNFIPELDNLRRAIQNFYRCVCDGNRSNINMSIRITETLQNLIEGI